ncbi:Hypothetical Protein FCC1311_017282 [Hondaea fermentalgiana]|uniref:C2HC/C3H-type domain-containing protein n=1 Tax=Hondaea fermentalgiana TaxID=2315210 RepID=A0A2R5G583_9STRA|nr:Hypothetical Protein FCC1311_017282 [Hondaea fermentalgiana]|eukprot:GBG25509.1 Hypothetical Protein FCC1311_017282 [Hondaea fermentalgiana]
MGNGASVTGAPVAQPTAEALRAKLDAIKLEANKDTREFDTPRGVTAKAEVDRLRALLKNTIEDGVHLEEVLKTIEAPPAEDDEDDGPDEREPCPKCNRKFNPDRIEKHVSVCKGDTKKSAADANAGDSSSDLAAADSKASGSGSRPGSSSKWKEDRAKMKEQLKRDQEAAKSKASEATDAADAAGAEAAEATYENGAEAPAAQEGEAAAPAAE